MTLNDVNNEYFDWLYGLVCKEGNSHISFRRLLMHLHNINFRYSIRKDQNRAEDGIDLRYRFFSFGDAMFIKGEKNGN